jgi:hypothetical protein
VTGALSVDVIAEVIKGSIFWNITPNSQLKIDQRFGGKYRMHLQDRRTDRTRIQRGKRREKRERIIRLYIPEDINSGQLVSGPNLN